MRAAPADNLAAGAMRAALGLDALMPGGSKRVLATGTLRRPLRLRRNLRARTRLPAFRSLERLQGRPSLRRAQARNRRKPPRKVLSLHRISSLDPRLNQTTANAIRAKLSPRRSPRPSQSKEG